MTEIKRKGTLQSIISCISNHFWSIPKGVNWTLRQFKTENLKFHLKKLSRTRDIQNYPNQGCSRIEFYTIFWDCTHADIHVIMIIILEAKRLLLKYSFFL